MNSISSQRRVLGERAIKSAFLLPLIGSLAFNRSAQAQTSFPSKPLTIAVPFGAGGSLDLTTRLIAQHLAERLGQNVLVENATGGGGMVGIQKVQRATADGYNLLMAGDSPLNPTPAAGESHYRIDMINDMTPVALVNTAPMVLVANNNFKANNFNEFLALLRANPGRFNYATSGIGTILHLTMEMMKQQARVFITHIAYRGGAQIVTDVISNQIETALLINASALPAIRAGQLKAIAVTSEKRLPWLPNVPCVAETPGFANFNVVSWAGLYAPPKTPATVVTKLNQEVEAILKLEPVRSRMTEFGALPMGGPPTAFTKFISDDRARFAKVLKSVPLS